MALELTASYQPTEYVVDEDLALARKVSQGDEEAFEILYDRYYKQIYLHVSGMVKTREDAEDLTQEVFLRVYSSIGTYSGRASLGRWMRRVATNLCIDKMRKKRVPTVSWPVLISRDGDEQPVEFADDEHELLDLLEAQDGRDTILKAIESLPDYYRDTVMLHDVLEYPGKEVAKRMSCPVGTVKSRLSRARNVLQAMVVDSGMAVDSGWQCAGSARAASF
ncbi:MAG: RNA polymerase sigma factor [Bacillota bacterium]|jgi:RNA polymerase sigma-70 factor (ECF subfamily)|nr:RNA polymerase sigma factor [Candidatus Fermentithermobacillaceae bacterium]